MVHLQNLTVYLGSSGRARAVFQDGAARMGALIAKSGKRLIYGGMDAGLMGELARGAMEAGGEVTGIIPYRLKDSERILGGLAETIFVNDLWERKRKMFDLAQAIIALPGGFGTLDEALEVLYWADLKLHNKALAFVNPEHYWDEAIAFIRAQKDFDPRFLIVADKVEDVMAALEAWTPPPAPVSPPAHFPHFEDEIASAPDEPIIIREASIKAAYYAISALGLKQLGKHKRPIGFLNTGGQFDDLLTWIKRAADEAFITQKCLQLFDVADNEAALIVLLKNQKPVEIDLHAQKWGERREKLRDKN